MNNNFAEKFKELEKDIVDEQRRLSSKSTLAIYYGITSDKKYRLSFVSSVSPFELESTKEIKVTQGKESENVYWTCFDLLHNEAKDVFFIFCDSLVDSVEDYKDDFGALNAIRERYHSWRLLLKNKGKMSYELYQGLYGELYFLSEILSKKVSIENAIKAWVGPDGYSKDYSINSTWYEIKTIGANSTSIKINSLTQLDSEVDGHLVSIGVEKMSDNFDNYMCSVHKIYQNIIDKISDNLVKEEFINKVLKYGYTDEDYESNNHKFEVRWIKSYFVNDKFPKIIRNKLNIPEISNVTYELNISSLDKYKEVL